MGGVDNLVGNIAGFIENFQKAIVVSADIMYDVSAKTWLGMGYALNNQIQEAETLLKEVVAFCEENEFDWAGMPARLFLGTALVAKGNMRQGFKMIDEAHRSFFREQRRYHVALTDYILGKIYSQIVEGSGPVSPLTVAKNIGFLVKNVPFADKKADTHFSKAIELAENIGAKSITGPAYLDWGRLHKAKKRTDQAKECISKALELFEQCEANAHLRQAKEALASLN